jgi:DNA polymerase III delta prime subunit
MYFDTEPYNNWNVEKAYEVYKNNTNTSSDVFKDMKKDLEDIKNSVNTFKKAREKAEEILLKWDVSNCIIFMTVPLISCMVSIEIY